jgi:5-formyltetrahydrofolate cyclo-ligase
MFKNIHIHCSILLFSHRFSPLCKSVCNPLYNGDLMSSEDKVELRRVMLEKRRNLSEDERHKAALSIGSFFASYLGDHLPHSVAAYMPIRGEIDPKVCIAEARQRSLILSLPVLTGASSMEFRTFSDNAKLVDAGFSTRGPDHRADVAEPDLILVPLVAFDRRGVRLGYGKGFYDRYLAKRRAKGHPPRTIGLAYSIQEIDSLPCESHDIVLDMIMTEREVISIS